MPAPKLFLNSSDIALITGMSIRSAQNMLSMFAMQGKVVRSGESNRGQLVDINIFVKHLCEQDGADPKERKRDILDCLKEINGGHRRRAVK